MRALLVLVVVPMVWTLFWVLLRLFLTTRLASRSRGTVIEGVWRDTDEPIPVRPLRRGPACGRPAVHAFLRMFGDEDDCRRCAEVAAERSAAEREAAVEEAERQLSTGRDEP